MKMIPNNNIYWPDFGLVQKWTKVLWQKLSDYPLMQYSRRSFIPRSQPSGQSWHHVLSHGPQYSWLVHQWLPGAADLNISLNTILDLRNELSLDPMSGWFLFSLKKIFFKQRAPYLLSSDKRFHSGKNQIKRDETWLISLSDLNTYQRDSPAHCEHVPCTIRLTMVEGRSSKMEVCQAVS